MVFLYLWQGPVVGIVENRRLLTTGFILTEIMLFTVLRFSAFHDLIALHSEGKESVLKPQLTPSSNLAGNYS